MSWRRNNLFNIEPENDFALTLARFILTLEQKETTPLSDFIIFLPSNRAVKEVQDAFLQIKDAKAMLLPRLISLGELADNEMEDVSLASLRAPGTKSPSIAISHTQEVASLYGLLRANQSLFDDPPKPAQLWGLSEELSALYQEFERHGISHKNVKDLVPEDYAHHWQTSLSLLQIILKDYPSHLHEKQFVSREKLLAQALDSYAIALEKSDTPVIIAGTTASRPAVAKFIKHVMKRQNSYIVMPALDIEMPDEHWNGIEPSHPQWLLKQLLKEIKRQRHEVIDIGEAPAKLRTSLLRDCLAPSFEAANWHTSDYQETLDNALFEQLRYLEVDHPREEATSIALALREVLETPGKTAILATSDRSLAKMVSQQLRFYGIEADDAAGSPLAQSAQARLMRLIIDCVMRNFAPIPLLAFLNHPMVRLGYRRQELRRLSRLLDTKVLRGPRPAPGITGLVSRLDASQKYINPNDYHALKGLCAKLSNWSKDLFKAAAPPKDLLIDHIRALDSATLALSDDPLADHHDDNSFWSGEAGQALQSHMLNLIDALAGSQAITPQDYTALFDSWLIGQSVKPRYQRHPRIQIVGPLEIRSKSADLIVVAGLNEDSWPKSAEPDAWLNRAMRQSLGLPSPDVRIGQAAHDLTLAFGAREILITRSRKAAGSPTVKSRWLYRLEALAGRPLPQSKELRQYGELLDQRLAPAKNQRAALRRAIAPRPTPPIGARPTRFSVSDVQSWMRDPYALYAKKILGLRVLNPIDADPSAADKGALLHDCLEAFMRYQLDSGYVHKSHKESLDTLIEIGRERFKELESQPTVKAFWWPRFLNLADAFLKHGENWWTNHTTKVIEEEGELHLANGALTIFARADRIDLDQHDHAIIIDYKTGGIPSMRQIKYGYAPQLTLEALIAGSGGFKKLGAKPAISLQYWLTKGGEKPLEVILAEKRVKTDVDDLVAAAESGVIQLFKTFQNPTTPYLSNPRPSEKGYGDYDHLARVNEWQSGENDTAETNSDEKPTDTGAYKKKQNITRKRL